MTVEVKIFNADTTILNKLKHLGLRNITVCDSKISFITSILRQGQIKQILRNHDHQITKQKSFLDVFSFLYSRLALVACLIVAICAFSVLNNFVFRIDIQGVDTDQARDVSLFLQESGVRPLTLKARYRHTDFSPMLISQFPFIAHASTQIRGTRLVFNIYQAPNPPELPYINIVARFDSVIEEIIVLSGTQVVNTGQVVRSGQILVRAARQVGDFEDGTTDEMGRPIMTPVEIPTHALAIITGRVVASASITVESKSEVLIATTSLISEIQANHFGVTFIYMESFVTGNTVEVTLSTGTISLI